MAIITFAAILALIAMDIFVILFVDWRDRRIGKRTNDNE
jgi:hypothetical protein